MQSLSNLDGHEISQFWIVEESGDPIQRLLTNGETAWLSSEDYGDHDEYWIVVMKDGKETSRHNTKYVDSIEWK